MPKLSIEIPDEIMSLIEDDGYDLHSYFYLVFMRPLLERHKVKLQEEVIANSQIEIDKEIEAVKGSVSVTIEKEVTEPDPGPAPEPEPEPTEPPIEEPPSEEQPVEP